MNKEKIQIIFLAAAPTYLEHNSTQTKNLRNTGSKVEKFILLNFQKTKFKIETTEDITFIEIPRVTFFLYLPKIIKKIKDTINNETKTIISTVNPYDLGLIGILLKLLLRLPLQMQIHHDLFSKYYINSKKRHRFYFLLSKFTLPFASTIRTHSKNTANILQKKYPSKIVKQIKEIADFSDIPVTVSKNTNGILYLSPSRYDSQKNLFNLIEAFVKFNKEYPDTKLRIIGRGPLENDLRLSIEQNNARDYIDLAGWSNDMPNEYTRANFSVLSSIFEGYSMSVIESFRYGTPFLATPATGSTELIINGKNGYLAKGFSVEDIYDMLVESYKNKNIFNPETIKDTVKDFTKDNMDKEMIELWRETNTK